MASNTANLLMVMLMCFLAVNAEKEYKFIEKRPLDYPQYEDDQYMNLLKNVKFPNRAPSEVPVYKDHCDSNDIGRLCCSVTVPIRPYVLKTPEGKQKWVYQSSYFEQYIPETRCKSEGSTCFSDFKPNLMGTYLEPKCKTDRGSISLLTHDGDSADSDLRWITVSIDVSCSCHLTKKPKG